MLSQPQDLLDIAKSVIKNAYAPYSKFSVAAVVRSKSGEIFSCCNVENAAFPLGVCAESGAISAMVAAGEREIVEVLILVADKKICPPCGACRQRLLEFASSGLSIHLCTLDGQYKKYTLDELLPVAFGPKNLE